MILGTIIDRSGAFIHNGDSRTVYALPGSSTVRKNATAATATVENIVRCPDIGCSDHGLWSRDVRTFSRHLNALYSFLQE